MVHHFSNSVSLLASITILICGCNEGGGDSDGLELVSSNIALVSTSATTNQQETAAQCLSPEMSMLAQMKDKLDKGDNLNAMQLGRALMDTTNAQVKSELIEVFAWIGKKALDELAEMMSDPNPRLANEALTAWENALNEISHDRIKAERIVLAMRYAKRQEIAEAILMQFAGMENKVSLPALERIILDYKGTLQSACAKETFKDFAGEDWCSIQRTAIISADENEKGNGLSGYKTEPLMRCEQSSVNELTTEVSK